MLVFLQNYTIDKDVVEGTIHCKIAAAEVLVEQLYTTLTNRHTYRLNPRTHTFNDLTYQVYFDGLKHTNYYECFYVNSIKERDKSLAGNAY